MAEDKQNNPQPNKGEDQPSKNGKDNPVKAKFEHFTSELEALEIEEANTALEVAQDNLLQSESTIENNNIKWIKSKDNLEEYLLIKHEISLKLVQGVTELQEDVQTSKEKFTEMDGLFAIACTSIKDVSKKILLVNGAIAQLENAITDSCNQKEVETYKDLKKKIKQLSETCNGIAEKASANVSASVKAAGVKALLNLDSLVEMGNQIKIETESFKSNVDTNITSSITNEATTKESFNQSIIEYSKAKADNDITSLKKEGLDKLRDFSDSDQVREASEIDEIVEDAEKNFEPQHQG